MAGKGEGEGEGGILRTTQVLRIIWDSRIPERKLKRGGLRKSFGSPWK